MDFRVGDRVTAKGNMPGFEGPGTIDRVDASNSMYGYRIIYDCNPGCHIWSYTNSVKPLNPSDKILITSDGVTTTAKQFDGKKLVKAETAKCAPDDTYEFGVGAKIAFDRLMNGRPGRVDKPDVTVYKSGDKVKITGNSCHHYCKTGQVVTLTERTTRGYWDKPFPIWHIKEAACFVSESDITPTPSRQHPSRIRCCCTASESTNPGEWLTKGKIYELINGKVKMDDGYVTAYGIGTLGDTPFKSYFAELIKRPRNGRGVGVC